MNRTLFVAVSVMISALLVLAACGSDDNGTNDDSGDAPQSETAQNGDTGSDATEEPADDVDDQADESDDVAETPGASDDQSDDADDQADDTATAESESASGDATPDSQSGTGGAGATTFTARDAGEVDLNWDGENLELVEVRANDGWDYRIDDDDDDEIEVDFRMENREVDFDAEIDDGRLHIELGDDWDDTQPGTFVVAEAGEVEFERDGDSLNLIEVRPNDGWDHRVGDQDDEEIEVEFRRGDDDAEFEAEVDDGRLNVDITTEWYVQDGQ